MADWRMPLGSNNGTGNSPAGVYIGYQGDRGVYKGYRAGNQFAHIAEEYHACGCAGGQQVAALLPHSCCRPCTAPAIPSSCQEVTVTAPDKNLVIARFWPKQWPLRCLTHFAWAVTWLPKPVVSHHSLFTNHLYVVVVVLSAEIF